MNVRLKKEAIDVFIVTEIKTGKDDIIRVSGYDIIYNSRKWGKGKGGGVLIGIKKDILWERLKGKEKDTGYRGLEKK